MKVEDVVRIVDELQELSIDVIMQDDVDGVPETYSMKGEVMNEKYAWIHALIWSYYYNRDRQDIVHMIQGVINRILDSPYEGCNAGDDDTDILMGAIVEMYGEYGTSPRYGWIDEEHKENVLNTLRELLEYHTEQLEHED